MIGKAGRTTLTAVLGIGVCASLAADRTAAAQSHDMKIGFVTINDSQHASAKMFAAEIKKRSGGRLTARIFPAAQLGKIPRQIEGIQLGTQEAFLSPPGFFVGIDQAFQVPDAPGLFDSIPHVHRVINHPSVRGKFLTLAERAGIVGTYIWGVANTSIASRVPIRTLADMRGKKIRVLATKMEIELMKEFGVTGVPIPYSEVLPSIQRRTIDGARSAVIVMGPSKFFTVAKHLILIHSSHVVTAMWTSKVWLNKLPEDLRAAVYATGLAITEDSLKSAVEITAKWEKLWIENGGTVNRLSAAEHQEFFRRAKPLGDRLLSGNPKTREMYALVKAAAEATR